MIDEQTAFVTKNLDGDVIEVVPRKVYDRVVAELQKRLAEAVASGSKL